VFDKCGIEPKGISRGDAGNAENVKGYRPLVLTQGIALLFSAFSAPPRENMLAVLRNEDI